MPTKTFDLVVIGTGSAASTVASQCRAAGWQTAIVDSRPFGGTCALRGCDPKKVLVGAAEVMTLDMMHSFQQAIGECNDRSQTILSFRRSSYNNALPEWHHILFAMSRNVPPAIPLPPCQYLKEPLA